MRCNRSAVFACLLTVLLASPMLFVGVTWGLPSRSADRVLYGEREPWSGRKIFDLAGGWEDAAAVGADVAQHPLAGRDQVLVLNDNDVARARIALRYRLYSYQPDEASTFRSLSKMRPGGPYGGMDPKYYQYGGLWIYPVGVLLRVAGAFGWVTLRTDVPWYIDHPEAFGRFYVVARCYSAMWGLIGVATVFVIVRRLTRGLLFPAAAGLLFATLPVVVNMAHEVKPHLGGAVLMLLASLAASWYAETGRTRAWVIAGAFCGLATGMILSALVAFVLLPLMTLFRPDPIRLRLRITLAAGAVGALAYLLTNPYVGINLIVNRPLLRSNLGNTAAMYHANASGSAASNAAMLIAEGASPLVALAGVVGSAMLAVRAVRMRSNTEPAEVRRRATGLLLAAPAVLVAIQYVMFAAGKPGEYARFALLCDAVLAIEAVVAVATFVQLPSLRPVKLAVLVVTTGWFGGLYAADFVRDARRETPRMKWAQQLEQMRRALSHRSSASTTRPVLVLDAEPAPYCLPPVNLFAWEMRLAPRGATAPSILEVGDVSVRALDACESASFFGGITSTRISWASKWFEVRATGRMAECHRQPE